MDFEIGSNQAAQFSSTSDKLFILVTKNTAQGDYGVSESLLTRIDMSSSSPNVDLMLKLDNAEARAMIQISDYLLIGTGFMKESSGNENVLKLSRLSGDSMEDIDIRYEDSQYNTDSTGW